MFTTFKMKKATAWRSLQLLSLVYIRVTRDAFFVVNSCVANWSSDTIKNVARLASVQNGLNVASLISVPEETFHAYFVTGVHCVVRKTKK